MTVWFVMMVQTIGLCQDCGFPIVFIDDSDGFDHYFKDQKMCDTLNYPITIENVSDLTKMNFLKKINHDLSISFTRQGFNELIGLDSLEEAHDIEIRGFLLSDLKRINILQSLKKANSIKIIGHNNLLSVGEIPLIDSLRFFQLSGNQSISTIDFLPNLVKCNSFIITLNDNLESIEIEENLNDVIEFTVSSNESLEEITLPKTTFKNRGRITLRNLPSLLKINSQKNRSKYLYDLFFSELPNLQSFDGLNLLSKVERYFAFGDCSLIENIGQYENLDTIGLFGVWNNNNLDNLEGVSGVKYLSDSLYIKSNPKLSMCDIESFCDFIDRNPIGTIVCDNKQNCNTGEEILQSCIATNTENILNRNNFITVKPNPVYDLLECHLSDNYIGENIQLIGSNGNVYFAETVRGNISSFNISNLNGGIYFIKIKDRVIKIIKI